MACKIYNTKIRLHCTFVSILFMPDHLIKSIQPYAIGIVFVLLYLAEHIFPQRPDHANAKHDLRNFGIGLINAGITFGGGYYFQKIIEWLNLHRIGLFNWISFPEYLSIGLQILLIDLNMYWWHRLNHTYSFLWKFHRFHHLDKQMNSTTALRFHAVELLLSYVFRLLVFPLFGFSIMAIVCYSFLFFPVVILHHSNLSIKETFDMLLRKVIVSPGMHRIHHSKKKEETDSNYSSVFPWWDAVFKTYRKKPIEPIQFGVE